MNIEQLIEEIDAKIETFIDEDYKRVEYKDMKRFDFDPRAHVSGLYAGKDGFAVCGSTRAFDYYGGMEYVKDDERRVVGSWTFYLAEGSERVRGHLARGGVLESDEEEDE